MPRICNSVEGVHRQAGLAKASLGEGWRCLAIYAAIVAAGSEDGGGNIARAVCCLCQLSGESECGNGTESEYEGRDGGRSGWTYWARAGDPGRRSGNKKRAEEETTRERANGPMRWTPAPVCGDGTSSSDNASKLLSAGPEATVIL